MENNKQQVGVAPLSLPKGGGAITGMGESLGAIGPSGLANLTVPLLISAGRGYAPALALSYNSGSGNGPFGLGWNMGIMAIARRTARGVPHYDHRDEFIGPNGEVLIAVSESDKVSPDQNGKLVDFTVTHYQPRIEGGFDRIEFWQPKDTASALTTFWRVYSTDGQQHCLGKTAQAHIANPDNPMQIAEWLLEESVSATGEHICYDYQSEDDTHVDATESAAHPQASAQRYLKQVRYGNLTSNDTLFAGQKSQPKDDQWLFRLVFDYGERTNTLPVAPALTTSGTWSCRQDPFSRYEYGFEIRTRRLCQQVLMFHNLQLLSDDKNESDAALVARLRLNYLASPYASQLISCQQVAHEPDGTTLTLPPLEFDYQELQAEVETNWQAMPEWNKFSPYYQLIDLNGEGLPGMLYQDSSSWRYHPPVRTPDSQDGVSFGAAQTLPKIPVLRGPANLMDINGDGQLDWVISQSGISGYYSRKPDESWTQFTPLSALPAEYFHPQAQLADLIGNGLSDLALIGPKSVRLYANQRDGFAAAQQVYQDPAIALPIPGASEAELVAFSDPLGSGQQHLLRVRHNSVTCWPNLGHGTFGKPVTLNGFNQPAKSFNPQHIWLADIDGSGTVDLIYARSDHLLIYRNQSGNRFAAPLKLPLPKGVRYDNTCQLTMADVQGLGVTSLLLSVPHMANRHWRYDFTTTKPYLLCTVNNNMGAESRLSYRSSAQFWLDEKAAAASKKQKIACGMPFPMHLLARTTQFDEITHNSLSQQAFYYHGFYDGIEREFRGFGRVDTLDTHAEAQGSAQERTPPSLSRSWFHTGRADDETRYQTEYWQGDDQAYQLGTTRLTAFNSQAETDDLLAETTTEQRYWLYRALKGSLLHSELYGLDDIGLNDVPYTTSSARYQVRQVRSSDNTAVSSITMPMSLEQLSYHYERIPQDPQCSQSIVMRCNEYGHPLHSVAINYPRRPQGKVTPYSWLATDHWASSYDEQQLLLRISESQQSYRHVIEDNQQQLQPGQPLQWDARNQLQQVITVKRDDDNNDYESYLYGSDGMRIVKQSIQQNQTSKVVYLPGLELRTQHNNHKLTEDFQVITVGAAGRAQVRVLRWQHGKPEGIDNDQLRYSFDNQIGSSLLELDHNGDIISQEEYYPFGGTAVFASRNTVEAKYKTVRYSGKERDATGLYYYGLRYYMPWLGRWLSSDPAGTIYGLNLYRMVRNNPISLMDEDGLKPHDRKQGFIYSPFSDMGALEQIVGKNAQRILNKKQIMPIIVDTEKQKKELLLNLKSVLLSEGKATALTKILGIIDQMDGGEPPQYSALSEAVAPSNFKVSSLEKTTALKNLDPSQHKLLLIGHGSAGVPALSNDDEKSIRTFKELAENFKSSGLPMNFSDIKLTSCHSGDDNIIIGSIIPPGESLDEAPAQYFANELGKIGYKEVRVYGYRGMGDRFTLANNIHKTRSIISSSGKKQRGEQVCIVIYSRIKI